MKQDIQMTVMAFAVIAGLFLFQQCTETVFKKKQAEQRAITAEVALPADLPAEWTEDCPPAKSEALKTAEAEKEGIKAVNADFKQAFGTLGDHIGTQWNKIDRSAVVNDMKVQANQLARRIDRLEKKITKDYGEHQAKAETLPLRQLHSDLLDQIAAAEQADARDWSEMRADQRFSFKFLRDDLRDELALTEELLDEGLQNGSEPQLASSGK
ncbi:MAG: hypothetical protein K9J06_06815 [Flavobacteriales bacterium]|nr:hypothetical protein [Flavobacteriales bacterium]